MANTAGGNDNISVQILAYGPIPPPQQSETWFPFSNAITMALCLFIALGLFFVAGYVVGKYNQSLPTERTQLETNRESSQSHTDQSSVPTRDTELAPIDERLPDILENSELSLGEITTIPPIDSKAAPKQPASDLKLPKTVQPLTKPALIKTTPDQVAPKQPASDITAPASARELPKTIHTSTKPALIKTTPATRPAAMPSEHLPSTLPTHIEDSK
jgi:cytoskeletal protein RodZ